jgi:hypothetical protein
VDLGRGGRLESVDCIGEIAFLGASGFGNEIGVVEGGVTTLSGVGITMEILPTFLIGIPSTDLMFALEHLEQQALK